VKKAARRKIGTVASSKREGVVQPEGEGKGALRGPGAVLLRTWGGVRNVVRREKKKTYRAYRKSLIFSPQAGKVGGQ
jgi:hypothetical protein